MGGLPERSEEFHFLDNLKRSVVVAGFAAGFAGGAQLPEHPSHSLAFSVLLGTGLGRVVSFVACFSHLNRGGSVLLGNADSLSPPTQLSGIGTGLGRVVSMVACFSHLNSSGSVGLDSVGGCLDGMAPPASFLGSGTGLGRVVVRMVGLSSKLDSSGSVLLDGLEPSKLQLGSGTGLGKAGGLPEVVAHMGSLESHTEPLLLLHGSGTGLKQAEVFVEIPAHLGSPEGHTEPLLPLHGSGAGLGQAHVSFDG